MLLASGFMFAGLLLVPHALTFPGAFAPGGLLGPGVSSTGWLATFWRWAFPITVILYAILKWAEAAAQPEAERRYTKVWGWLGSAIACSVLVTVLALRGNDLLPSLFLDRRHANYTNMLLTHSVTVVLTIAAMAFLWRHAQSVLDMWLMIALSMWLIQTLLNVPLYARFTIGWYGLYVMMLVSHLIVLLALIAEASQLYARLALTMMAQKREREARLMSMDAVASTIAHEVRQPLTAIALNASAVLSWLNRTPLDPTAIAKPAKAIIDDSHRASDIIDSIRLVPGRQPDHRATLSLNELVREATALLGREIASAKVSLQLAMDEALPPIVADRVQMRQVLVNLLSNAIESLVGTQGRVRQIVVRSVPMNKEHVLIEIRDTGIGIAPGQAESIFDAFYTTKVTGMGLGLSLCRRIVEEHGGRLWASSGEEYGAVFHLQLPTHGSAE
jgi:signal transduction histidine kinase